MKKNKFKIKISKFKIFFFFIFFYFFLSFFLLHSDLFFNLKKKIPTFIKDPIKKYVLYFPIKVREYINAVERINIIEQNLNEIRYSILGIRSEILSGKFQRFELESENKIKFTFLKVFLPLGIFSQDYTAVKNQVANNNFIPKRSGYIELFKDQIIIVFWSGKVVTLNVKDLLDILNSQSIKSENILIKNILNNLDKFLNRSEDKFIGIKDILIYQDYLYASYTKTVESDCINTSILRSSLNNFQSGELFFEEFFTYPQCSKTRNGGYQSGGRMEILDKKLYLTIGDFQDFDVAQKKDSFFGKIISLDLEDKSIKIISMGHRNPQGLLLIKDKNILIETEHGQNGGDEINVIDLKRKDILNFGWPISSYSDYYGYEDYEIRKKAPFYKSHSKYGFIEPIIYFTPSLGISQIVFTNSINNKNFIVSSLKNKSLYFVKFSEDFMNINVYDRLFLGERVRDIVVYNNYYLIFGETTSALIMMKKN
jgi:hypothetical protein